MKSSIHLSPLTFQFTVNEPTDDTNMHGFLLVNKMTRISYIASLACVGFAKCLLGSRRNIGYPQINLQFFDVY